MSDDAEHLVYTVPRGRGELRMYRERREGRCETRLQVWYRDADGVLQPSRSSARIRDAELAEVLEVLQRIARKIAKAKPPDDDDDDCPPERRAPTHTEQRYPGCDQLDMEGVF